MVLRSASTYRLVNFLPAPEYYFITYNVRERGKCLKTVLDAYNHFEHFCETHQLGDLSRWLRLVSSHELAMIRSKKRLQLTASPRLNPEHGVNSCLQPACQKSIQGIQGIYEYS
jgi:hypothetical protein